MSKQTEGMVLLLAGLVLILFVSVVNGADQAFFAAFDQLAKIVTVDLLTNIYIAGIILIVLGIIKYYTKGSNK